MHWTSRSTSIIDLKVVSVFLLDFYICFFLLSFSYFYYYYSNEFGKGGYQPVVALYILNFSHQNEADINFLVPVLKFLGKRLILAQLGSASAWTNQQCP